MARCKDCRHYERGCWVSCGWCHGQKRLKRIVQGDEEKDAPCRWYEPKEVKEQCQSCKHKIPVPFLLQEEDPECPYVRCGISGKVMAKWDDCEDWEENHG